jgi:hypothetical protein
MMGLGHIISIPNNNKEVKFLSTYFLSGHPLTNFVKVEQYGQLGILIQLDLSNSE